MDRLTDRYVSSGEAAKLLRMHPLAVQKLIYDGRLPAEKIANRWLIPRTVVEELAKTYSRIRPRSHVLS